MMTSIVVTAKTMLGQHICHILIYFIYIYTFLHEYLCAHLGHIGAESVTKAGTDVLLFTQ